MKVPSTSDHRSMGESSSACPETAVGAAYGGRPNPSNCSQPRGPAQPQPGGRHRPALRGGPCRPPVLREGPNTVGRPPRTQKKEDTGPHDPGARPPRF
jgi:hypothetical protein